MFTCCKNTFPNFNITHSHFQTFIHSFLVRWLDVSAKRKQNRIKSQTCAQKGGTRGEAVSKNKAVLHSEGRKTWDKRHDRGRLLEDMCAFEPWESKSDRFSPSFSAVFFFLTDHTSVRYVLPLPVPLGLWQQWKRCFKSLKMWGGGAGWEVWGREHSHTQEWNISCGFVNRYTVLIR